MKPQKKWELYRVCGVCLILALIWMGVIFAFSAKTADESTVESNTVGMLLGKILIPDFEQWSEEKQQSFAENWEYPIRKTAHMTEYAVLGFLLVGAWTGKRFRSCRLTAACAFATAVLYAVSDEIHQYFVPGRACRLYDVGFDSAGALIGVVIGVICFRRKLQK
jgi:VanZ family protein